jgi:hypothetical protein
MLNTGEYKDPWAPLDDKYCSLAEELIIAWAMLEGPGDNGGVPAGVPVSAEACAWVAFAARRGFACDPGYPLCLNVLYACTSGRTPRGTPA